MMKTLEIHFDKITDPVILHARRTKWCAKCDCFHEYHFFWRHKGMVKTCGNQFSKSALGVKTTAT